MFTPIHQASVDLLFDAMSQTAGTGFRASFMYGCPDDPLGHKGFGTEIYFNAEKLTRAALFLRDSGPSYLKYLTIEDVRKILQDFIINNYWYISEEWFFKRFDGTYAENISVQTRDILANKIATSDIFRPRSDLTLFPLIPVTMESSFTSDIFFFSSPEKLMAFANFTDTEARYLSPEQFPLTKSWKGRVGNPTSWLGVRAPAYQVAKKYRSIILGALALTPPPRSRYMCSGRKMFGGYCTISDNYETSFDNVHTPPLMENIILTEKDHVWLKGLSELLSDANRMTRRKLRALEYFYRACRFPESDAIELL